MSGFDAIQLMFWPVIAIGMGYLAWGNALEGDVAMFAVDLFAIAVAGVNVGMVLLKPKAGR